jgi:hypothetical protein
MYKKKIELGEPFVFQEFFIFSPRQFNDKRELEEKDFVAKIKVCLNSDRVFTGPFYDSSAMQSELTKKELNQILDMVYNTPEMIIVGQEYALHDEHNVLRDYYVGPVAQRQRQTT